MQKMYETDPGPLPTSKMQLAVTIINGSPMQVSRIGQETGSFIIYYPHYCYRVKSPASAIILLSLFISLLLNQARFAPLIP